MAVIESNQTNSNNVSGFDKGIHASARTMMLDNLQGTMYQRPIDSAVRECVSNAVDAVREKNTAKQIITGAANVRDFYLSREDVKDKIGSNEDDIYQDSEFNADYYDLAFLDPKDTITLEYINGEQTKRDQFVITDSGVGLGGARLEGFFSLGYSSKRLNSGELGGFGLGAKSPLATGVESYRMLTRYNGKEFCFDIYSHKVDCVYAKWNEDGSSNSYVEFESVMVTEKVVNEAGDVGTIQVPYKAYYRNTKEKNSTSIIIEVKKHNRHKYFEAVKSQLMYLQADIKFTEVGATGHRQNVPFKAEPIYEDGNLVMSNYGYYSRPHFVLKGIAYGLIDFNEADLSVKYGNIGIKFNMEDLDIIPSRESVRYTPKTTQALIAKYDAVAKTVEAKVQEELKQDVLVDWVKACNKILYSSNSNSNDVITRMSSLTDNTELKPMFKDTNIKYSSDVRNFITPILNMQHIALERISNWGGKDKKKINRSDNQNILAFDKPLYFQFGPGKNRATNFFASTHEKDGGFCVFRTAPAVSYLEPLFDLFVRDKVTEADLLTKGYDEIKANEGDDKKSSSMMEQFKKAVEIVNYLKLGAGKSKVNLYTEDSVPEEFNFNEDGEDDGLPDDNDAEIAWEEQRRLEYKNTLKRRRENKAFIAHRFRNKTSSTYYAKVTLEKFEVSTKDLDFDNCKVVYATDDDAAALDFMMEVTRTAYKNYEDDNSLYHWNDTLKIFKVAKSNIRYVKDEGIKLADYLLGVEDGIVRSNERIRKTYTAKVISDMLLDKCNFMRNFSSLNSDVADSYQKLVKYVDDNGGRSNALINNSNKYTKFLNKYRDIHLIMIKNPSLTEEEYTQLIEDAFDEKMDIDVLGVDLIDIEMYKEAERMVSFADVYGCIFNYIGPLEDPYNSIIDADLINELKVILESKKDQLEYTYVGLNK